MIRQVVTLVSLLWTGLMGSAWAQESFFLVPRRIVDIKRELPCKVSSFDTTYSCPDVSTQFRISQRTSENGQLGQIGFQVFSPSERAYLGDAIADAFERYWMLAFMKKESAAGSSALREDDVKLVYNGYRLGTGGFPNLNVAVAVLRDAKRSVTVKGQDHSFVVSVTASSRNTLTMILPKSLEVIYGLDKKESDEVLFNRLLSRKYSFKAPVPVTSASVVTSADVEGLYEAGGDAFIIDSLTNKTYYRQVPGSRNFQPVYSASLPLQSIQNLLLGAVHYEGVTLKITHYQYGNVKREVVMPLCGYLASFQGDNDLYASAFKSTKTGDYEGVLISYNKFCNYINMLIVRVPEAVVGQTDVQLNASLYTNIPQGNILNLFAN